MGILWGTWHLLITFWMSGDADFRASPDRERVILGGNLAVAAVTETLHRPTGSWWLPFGL